MGVKEKNHKIRPAITGPLGQVELSGEILLKNQYDEAGRRLTTVGRYAGLSQTVTMEYDFFGRRIKEQHSGGLVGTFTYDNMDRFNSLNWSGGGISMSEVISSRSPSGLISKIDREFGTFNMSYNQKNELSRMSYAGSIPLDVQFNTDFNYDSSGNYLGRTNLTFNNINNFLVNTSSAKEYFPDAHGLGYRHSKYDYSFNLKQSYKYYPWGQLREMKEYVGSSERAKINYYYDGFGRRILKVKKLIGESVSTTEFSHLGLEDKVLLASVTKDSVPAKSLYVDGVGIDDHQFEISNVTGVTSYARDHLGSVISGSATGGKGVFGPFGENVGLLVQKNSPSIPIVYGFTGREFDPESGFYYYRGRYYDPQIGRFLTKDPIGLAGGDTNLYRYCRNNPINCVDPTGMVIVDLTGGQIPREVTGSRLYRELDASPHRIQVGIDPNYPAAGVTQYYNDGSQTVLINPNNQVDRNDLIDTYIHELNHVDLNNTFQGRTPEFIDTDVVLPGVIRDNFGSGGISAGQCR